MATLGPPMSPSTSPPFRRRTKSCARKCERYCCAIATYFPLAFVYGLTTWAVWVEASLGFTPSNNAWSGIHTSLLGILLYVLVNASYTVAVFTDPGSPVDKSASRASRYGYSHLPTSEPQNHNDPSVTSVTVSSTGSPRFCKKCLTPKPDRAHHCSTCRRCVLKMDHHCPWLATCVGLHNYKPFLLFLIYVSIFCWVCLGVTSQWLWAEVLADEQYLETLMPINVVMLGVVSGIIGVVLTGFTAWHITLAFRGVTTIESLEKTRYLTPLRNAHQQQLLRHQDPSYTDGLPENHNADLTSAISETLHKAGEQILNIHANAIPGATRIEEGEEHLSPTPTHNPIFHQNFHQPNNKNNNTTHLTMSPAQLSLSSHHHSRHADPNHEHQTPEQRQYAEYLDDEFSNRTLPHAFDLGYRRNLHHLFGPNPWFWFLPIPNTTGDGWRWEISPKWLRAREELAEERAREEERVGLRGGGGDNAYPHSHPHPHDYDPEYDYYDDAATTIAVEDGRRRPHSFRTVTTTTTAAADDDRGSGMSMHTLDLNSNSNNNKRRKRAPHHQKRVDFDRSGEHGEIESFVVSASSSSSSSNSSSDDDGGDSSGDNVVDDEPHRGDADGDGESAEWKRW